MTLLVAGSRQEVHIMIQEVGELTRIIFIHVKIETEN